jgi:hypothetical protein
MPLGIVKILRMGNDLIVKAAERNSIIEKEIRC